MAPVLAAEETGRLGAGEDDAGLAGMSGCDVPDGADNAGRGALPLARRSAWPGTGIGAREAGREGEGLAVVVPALTAVLALGHGAPPGKVVRRRVETRFRIAAVGGHVMEHPARQDGLRHLPLL